MSIPEINVQGWHHDGPVYRIHRKLAGWRNRKARRRGEQPFEQVGHPGGRNVEDAQHFLVYTDGNDEAYAFNRGHVYEVEQLVDGDVGKILVDARENFAVHSFVGGIELLGARGLDDDELEALLGDDGELGEPEQPSNVSDGVESQEAPGERADREYGSTPESRDAAYAAAANELYPDTTPADAELDAEDTAADDALEAARDSKGLEQPAAESEPAPGADEGSTGQDAEGSGASATPDDLTDEELEALTAPEAPADDEDAVGDDEDSADEEE